MTRLFVIACLALGIIGCDSLVRDSRGNPIVGAAIYFWPEIRETFFTNEDGLFGFPRTYVDLVYASKPGDETAVEIVSRAVRLTLHDVIRIPAGQSSQSVRVTVRPDDSLGGHNLAYRVRTLRVFSNGDRIVRVSVLADDNGPVDYRIQDNCGDICPQNPETVFIEGGGERQMWIQIPWRSTASRTFTVNTIANDP